MQNTVLPGWIPVLADGPAKTPLNYIFCAIMSFVRDHSRELSANPSYLSFGCKLGWSDTQRPLFRFGKSHDPEGTVGR